MDPKVTVRTLNNNNEIESQKEFTAIEMRSAKAQATRWINENCFTDEITIEKEEFTPHYQIWRLK